jgi:hypothetical protein
MTASSFGSRQPYETPAIATSGSRSIGARSAAASVLQLGARTANRGRATTAVSSRINLSMPAGEIEQLHVWIAHSLNFCSREQLFIPEKRWAVESRWHYSRLSLPPSGKHFLAPVLNRLRFGLQAVADAAKSGKLYVDDDLHLKALEAEDEDPEVIKHVVETTSVSCRRQLHSERYSAQPRREETPDEGRAENHFASAARSIIATTSLECESITTCEEPLISTVFLACARFAIKLCAEGGIFLSREP